MEPSRTDSGVSAGLRVAGTTDELSELRRLVDVLSDENASLRARLSDTDEISLSPPSPPPRQEPPRAELPAGVRNSVAPGTRLLLQRGYAKRPLRSFAEGFDGGDLLLATLDTGRRAADRPRDGRSQLPPPVLRPGEQVVVRWHTPTAFYSLDCEVIGPSSHARGGWRVRPLGHAHDVQQRRHARAPIDVGVQVSNPRFGSTLAAATDLSVQGMCCMLPSPMPFPVDLPVTVTFVIEGAKVNARGRVAHTAEVRGDAAREVIGIEFLSLSSQMREFLGAIVTQQLRPGRAPRER